MIREISEIQTDTNLIKWTQFEVPYYDYSVMIFDSGEVKYFKENTVIGNGKNDIRKEIKKKDFPECLLNFITEWRMLK